MNKYMTPTKQIIPFYAIIFCFKIFCKNAASPIISRFIIMEIIEFCRFF